MVICAYTETRWNELNRAIASIQQQTAAPCELIIVIDHNPRLYERVCEQLGYWNVPEIQRSSVIAIQNNQAQGLSGARNSGVAQARGAWIAFLDEDAVAAPNWLARLGAGYNAPNVLGVGGSIQPSWKRERPAWFPEEFDWVVGCTYRGMPHEPQPVRNLIGCNMSFRREVFDAVGGFQNGIGRIGALPMGCEETEFCIRLRQRWREGVLLYEPQAKVYHTVPSTRSNWKYFSSRCYAEGVSKAQVANLVGANDALASEKSYVTRTLPSGVMRNVSSALKNADPRGLARAGAILLGLLLTTAGYVKGTCIS